MTDAADPATHSTAMPPPDSPDTSYVPPPIPAQPWAGFPTKKHTLTMIAFLLVLDLVLPGALYASGNISLQRAVMGYAVLAVLTPMGMVVDAQKVLFEGRVEGGVGGHQWITKNVTCVDGMYLVGVGVLTMLSCFASAEGVAEVTFGQVNSFGCKVRVTGFFKGWYCLLLAGIWFTRKIIHWVFLHPFYLRARGEDLPPSSLPFILNVFTRGLPPILS